MIRLVFFAVVICFGGCSKTPTPEPPKPEGVSEIKSPTSAPPPVQALSYDAGYQSGDLAGEAAARASKAQPRLERRHISQLNGSIFCPECQLCPIGRKNNAPYVHVIRSMRSETLPLINFPDFQKRDINV